MQPAGDPHFRRWATSVFMVFCSSIVHTVSELLLTVVLFGAVKNYLLRNKSTTKFYFPGIYGNTLRVFSPSVSAFSLHLMISLVLGHAKSVRKATYRRRIRWFTLANSEMLGVWPSFKDLRRFFGSVTSASFNIRKIVVQWSA